MEARVTRPFVDRAAGGRARHVGEVLEADAERVAQLVGLGYAVAVEEAGETAAAADGAAEEAGAEEAVEEAVEPKPTAEDTKRTIMDWAMGRGVELDPKLTKARMLEAIEDL